MWERYLDEWVNAAQSRLYDVMAHPDLPKVFGSRLPDRLRDRVDEAIRAVAESGVAMECSSAGLRKAVGEMYPDPDWLEAMHALGVPVTLASDAHAPEDVGRDYPTLVAALRAAGFTTITRFSRRTARQEAIA